MRLPAQSMMPKEITLWRSSEFSERLRPLIHGRVSSKASDFYAAGSLPIVTNDDHHASVPRENPSNHSRRLVGNCCHCRIVDACCAISTGPVILSPGRAVCVGIS